MNAAAHTLDIEVTKDLAAQWGWFAAFGAMLVVIGVVAVGRAVTTTIASMQFFGALLIVAAVVEAAAAVWVGHWAGFFQHVLAAILFGVLGLVLVARPAITAEVLTFGMALVFVVGGLFDIVGSAGLGYAGWGWQALDGSFAIALGLLILFQWPASGLRTLGLIVGVWLMLYGAAWVALAWGMRGA